MGEIIKFIVAIVNELHDIVITIMYGLGFNVTDKQLHFWVIGLLGMGGFIVVQYLFRVLSKWSITAISFIYTITVLLVVVFAIEIQQKITGRGNMEFADAVIGLQGFIVLFLVYLVIRLLLAWSKRLYKSFTNKQSYPK
ncbi:hypothetical protein [Pseudalkalibacillus hwajinpoensis]|uniref:Uncharacterized protein n=1 Tax=Guptibacillus hwajinpoensis TaxID=208199 RepID=A0A4U1MKC4_9BACL|nr:hypothetical protein [Pseudalkalibacillus hwajinpoensis]TKD70952.1 hypothetical protein FBF83_10130 [Pseudalkalibacillus hwajinpoensis]